VHMLCNTV